MRDRDDTRASALTAKQTAMLEFIKDFIARNHYSPTFSEIRIGLGLGSNNTVAYHLEQLQAAGYITKQHDSPRTIRVMARD